GPHGSGALARADHAAERCAALGRGDGLEDARARFRGSRQHHAEAIEDGVSRGDDGGLRAIFPATLGDEIGDSRGGVHERTVAHLAIRDERSARAIVGVMPIPMRRSWCALVSVALVALVSMSADAEPRPVDPVAQVYLVPVGAFPGELLDDLLG